MPSRTARQAVRASLEPCAQAVWGHFEALYADLEALRAPVADRLGAGPATADEVSDLIRSAACSILVRRPVVGAGFVAAPGALADHELYLAWWQGDEHELLATSAAPASGDPLDYTRHEWFRFPRDTGERHLTGPFVDYVCTDEYVLTATVPVLVNGLMVGVVGADTLLETFETLMLPVVQASGATLVNHHGRAVVSADPLVAPGQLVDAAAFEQALPCGDLPLTVLG